LSFGKVLLSVGRITPRKGLLEFICQALPSVVAEYPDVVLLVIGDEAPDALNGTGTGSSANIMSRARELGLDRHVRILGACSDSELDAAYDAADVCVFPIREVPGDVEGFGMVAVEAAAHGLPTVAFNVGGVEDAVSDGCSGWLVPAGDYDALAKRIMQVVDLQRSPAVRAACRHFAEGFAWQKFGSSLRSELQRVIDSAKMK
jgi:phosphatidylinositol alpha-1,6-mannosyltransferase